jgi:hypothetical protein
MLAEMVYFEINPSLSVFLRNNLLLQRTKFVEQPPCARVSMMECHPVLTNI